MRVRLSVAFVTALLAGAVGLPGPAFAHKPVPDPLAKATATVAPAVMFVEVNWRGQLRDRSTGQVYADSDLALTIRCSGFGVSSDGYLITAGRCVDPADAMLVFAPALTDRYVRSGRITEANRTQFLGNLFVNAAIEGATPDAPPVRQVFVQRDSAEPGRTTGEAFPAKVVEEQEAALGDLALLKVEKSNLPMVALNKGADPAVGTDVLAIGYPTAQPNEDSANQVTRTGSVSALVTEAGRSTVQTDAAVALGMEGGPLVNLNGEVVGMLSHPPYGAGPPTVAVSSTAIAAELQRHGVHNDLGKLDKDWRDGLDAYYAGHYSDAIAKFDAVLAVVPSHTQAQEYQQKAVTLRQAEGEPTDNHLLLYVGAGIAILVLLVALLLFLRARRRRPAPAPASAEPSDPPAPSDAPADPAAQTSAAPVFRPATDEPQAEPTAGRPVTAGAPSFSASPVPGVPVAEPPASVPTAPVFAEPVLPGAPVSAEARPAQARRPLPSLVYCSNCGLAAAPGTEACATCGQRFP